MKSLITQITPTYASTSVGRRKEILMIRRGLGRFAELVGKAENDRVGK